MWLKLEKCQRDTLTFGLLIYRSVAKFRDYSWLHIQWYLWKWAFLEPFLALVSNLSHAKIFDKSVSSELTLNVTNELQC